MTEGWDPARTELPSAWHAVVDHLAAIGVTALFGLPADDLAVLTALEQHPMRTVLCRDQRSAVFMATGYALAAGRPGACVVGRGPAVTNALTGLLEARTARVPLLLYAAGTAAARAGTGAFQELDQLAAVRPLAKWAVRIDHPRRVCATLERAAVVATAGTPGPVYVELPDPIATAPVPRWLPWRSLAGQHPRPAPEALSESYRLLRTARRPLLLTGGGARHCNPNRQIERLAEVLGAGIATTASGRGTVPETHPLFCGLSGLYATAPAVRLWQEADLVVALGSRLEETATLGWPDPAQLPVVQVTVAESDVVTERPGVAVLADVAGTVAGWLELVPAQPPAPEPAWAARIARARREMAAQVGADPAATAPGVPMPELLAALARALPPDRVLVHENGLQDMWSYFYPYWVCHHRGGAVVPSEQTSLGFGAAAAVGVACAQPGRPVVALVGDGAFNLFAAELATLAGAGVGVLYIVLNNGGYGWLQANLDLTGGGSRFGFLAPRHDGLAALVRANGLSYARLSDHHQAERVLRRAWAACAAGRSAVVEACVDVRNVPPGLAELAGDVPVEPSWGDSAGRTNHREVV